MEESKALLTIFHGTGVTALLAAADTMLSWTPEMLSDTAPCARLGFLLQDRETAQSWDTILG